MLSRERAARRADRSSRQRVFASGDTLSLPPPGAVRQGEPCPVPHPAVEEDGAKAPAATGRQVFPYDPDPCRSRPPEGGPTAPHPGRFSLRSTRTGWPERGQPPFAAPGPCRAEHQRRATSKARQRNNRPQPVDNFSEHGTPPRSTRLVLLCGAPHRLCGATNDVRSRPSPPPPAAHRAAGSSDRRGCGGGHAADQHRAHCPARARTPATGRASRPSIAHPPNGRISPHVGRAPRAAPPRRDRARPRAPRPRLPPPPSTRPPPPALPRPATEPPPAARWARRRRSARPPRPLPTRRAGPPRRRTAMPPRVAARHAVRRRRRRRVRSQPRPFALGVTPPPGPAAIASPREQPARHRPGAVASRSTG